MGFKCPNCHKDFGTNQELLNEHIINDPDCLNIAKTSISDRVEEDLKKLNCEPEEVQGG